MQLTNFTSSFPCFVKPTRCDIECVNCPKILSFSLRDSGLPPSALPDPGPPVPTPRVSGPQRQRSSAHRSQSLAPPRRDPMAGLRAPCLCSPHLLLCPCQLPPSCLLWARAGGGPTVRRACGLGPQFDSPFRALLPPGHYPSQTHVAPLPTPRSHSLKHHNSLKLSLYLPTRKQ